MFYFVELLLLTVVHYINNRFSAESIVRSRYLQTVRYLTDNNFYHLQSIKKSSSHNTRIYKNVYILNTSKVVSLSSIKSVALYIVPPIQGMKKCLRGWTISTCKQQEGKG